MEKELNDNDFASRVSDIKRNLSMETDGLQVLARLIDNPGGTREFEDADKIGIAVILQGICDRISIMADDLDDVERDMERQEEKAA